MESLTEPEAPSLPRFTVITGLSGAGRSETAKCFEDLGYFVIDNLPPALIEKMAELMMLPATKVKQVALVVDARGGEFFSELERALLEVAQRGIEYRILFLEASDRALVRRFEESRRPHPLGEADRLIAGIIQERNMMRRLKDTADVIVDTTDLNVHELRDKINSMFAESGADNAIVVNVISFGFKRGLPLDADMLFDCRFLPNPHWVEDLRVLTGVHRKVRGYVLGREATQPFLTKVRELLSIVLPGFVKEGRHYLTIAVGCTGGKHRSVVVADEISRYLTEKGFNSTVSHRDIDRE